ncbi:MULTISPECIES: FeoB-associated Cys-rich membrane protein [unclassified Schlesneria]|uniref:FeoB-associated Cys-rich membrane protein n=1 Tax=Schlesneria TaxID=656899 RepID=UPI002EF470BC
MSTAWQMVIVAALVLWAAAILLLRIRRLFGTPASGSCCGGCQGCPAKETDQAQGLVQLQPPPMIKSH